MILGIIYSIFVARVENSVQLGQRNINIRRSQNPAAEYQSESVNAAQL